MSAEPSTPPRDPAPPGGDHRYLPIGDHGMVGDLHTIALVGNEGTIGWYCPGRFDAPSVFAALLDHDGGGHWKLAPSVEGWKTGQLYHPDTNVLITRFARGWGRYRTSCRWQPPATTRTA